MNQFIFVVVNVNGEREIWEFESILDMIATAERLLGYEEIAYILVDFVRITNLKELKSFEAGIRYFKNYLFNVR